MMGLAFVKYYFSTILLIVFNFIDFINNLIKSLKCVIFSLFTQRSFFFHQIKLIIIKKSEYFKVKRRDLPPDCITDSQLGKHHFIRLEKVSIHYVAAGDENKELMLLVHGFPEFWFSWRHQLRHFSKDYYVVALDQRGYGESEKPLSIENYTIDKLSQDLQQLIIAFKKERAILVGHNLGGSIALEAAARYPHLIHQLIILNAPHPALFPQVINKCWYMYFFNVPYITECFLSSNDLYFFEKTFTSPNGSPLCSPEELEAYKYTFSKPYALTCSLNYFRAIIRNYASKAPDSYQIKTKTLVIWGKKDIELSWQLAQVNKYYDDVTVKYIEDCSHWTQMDQPQLVNELMENFLK